MIMTKYTKPLVISVLIRRRCFTFKEIIFKPIRISGGSERICSRFLLFFLDSIDTDSDIYSIHVIITKKILINKYDRKLRTSRLYHPFFVVLSLLL